MEKISNGIYKHYKGGIYEVVGMATHSETLENMVVYKSVENGRIWVRPATMWNDVIEKNGEKTTRFAKIDE